MIFDYAKLGGEMAFHHAHKALTHGQHNSSQPSPNLLLTYMFIALINLGRTVLHWLNRFIRNDISDGSNTASWRRIILVRILAPWILFNLIRSNIAGFWYSLNFKEPWSTTDYPALCSDRTTNLLPWMSSEHPTFKSPWSNIRLLHVHPSNGLSGIEATLKRHSFLERPQYIALSYTWGDSARVKPITVNGKRMNVTENLWNALIHIRDPHRERVLWVDAISIDQSDNEEKSIQVSLMSFIYSRAEEVMIWLGDHKGPRWAEQAHPSDYHGDWAIRKATDYWAVTKYWLYILTQENYWTRCWIVQEIAMASRIRVLSGRISLPWPDFISLIRLYKSKTPLDSGTIENVLRLESLREARYVNSEAFSLDHLLEEFGDCFCSIDLDKVFAFVGMASDCLDGCLLVDYRKSPLTVYQDLIKHWNSRCLQTGSDAIGTTHFAAIARSILSKKSVFVPKVLTPPNIAENVESLLYLICGDDRAQYCSLVPTLRSLLTWADLGKGLLDRTLTYVFTGRTNTKSLWLTSTPEALQLWTPKDITEFDSNQRLVRIKGVIAGVVCDLGPMYHEFVEGSRIPARWAGRMGTIWGLACNASSMRSAKMINERLKMLLGPVADYRMRNFVSFNTDAPYSFYSSRLFIAFGPRREVVMGLAPWEVMSGDLLVQFWNTDAVLVVREKGDGKELSLVGRAGIVKDSGAIAWDVPTQRDDFEAQSEWTFDYLITISTLTRLTLDTIQWHGIELQFYDDASEQLRRTWTSHGFEMKDIEVFGDGASYDIVSDTSQLPHIDEIQTKDIERTCLLEPCQLYSSWRVEDSPGVRKLNRAGATR